MIKYILKPEYSLPVYLVHILIGILAAANAYFLIGWFVIVAASEVPNILRNRFNLNVHLNYLMVYLGSFEVLGRMARAMPIMPYELSKYVFTGLLLYGIFMRYNKGTIGLFMLLLIIPGAFYDDSGEVGYENILFNLGGAIDIALGVIYFRGQEISRNQLMNIVRLALMPTIGVLLFAFVRTPDYDTIDFGLSSNFATSGGFGSNQVSTILGLGLFLMFVLWLAEKKVTGNKFLDLALAMGFVFQGLLTFSRGGMTGSGVAILTVLFLLTVSGMSLTEYNVFNLPKVAIYIIPIVISGIIVFQIADDITGNNLTLRYRGETAGTLGGSKELDFNTITTNRYAIFMGDIELWQENFYWGVGVGASTALRPTTDDEVTAAHVELSRLLAEHGLPGLFFFLMMLSLPFSIRELNDSSMIRAILFGFFVLAFYSTFHAATRTYVTPLFICLCLVKVIPDKIYYDAKYQLSHLTR